MFITTQHMQGQNLGLITTTTIWGRKWMVIKKLIGLLRFHEKSGFSHGMMVNDGDTWPPILLSQLIWYLRKHKIFQ